MRAFPAAAPGGSRAVAPKTRLLTHLDQSDKRARWHGTPVGLLRPISCSTLSRDSRISIESDKETNLDPVESRQESPRCSRLPRLAARVRSVQSLTCLRHRGSSRASRPFNPPGRRLIRWPKLAVVLFLSEHCDAAVFRLAGSRRTRRFVANFRPTQLWRDGNGL